MLLITVTLASLFHANYAYSGPILSKGAQTSPARGLIVSIDNRDLQWDFKDKHYPTLTSVINRDYALSQQYDFLYVQNDVKDLVPRIKAKYPEAVEDDMMKSEQVAKDVATGFNVHLKQYRAASWAKLPALWNLTVTFKGARILLPLPIPCPHALP